MEEREIEGRILKGIGGFYYVEGPDGEVYECRAKGKFRLDGITPMPGDRALFTPARDAGSGSIDEILPRTNSLVRPMVANIDLLLILISSKKPLADLLLVDKLLIYAAAAGIPAALGANKVDMGDPRQLLCQYEKSGARLLAFSAKEREGLEAVGDLLKGKCVCLAGQSAVGKSSLVNALSPGLELETGGLSKKTARGRHTTRHSELLQLKELRAVVVDTPGFSVLECLALEPEELKNYYPEFGGISCRFGGRCLHDHEPECGVKRAVEAGEVSRERYERYLLILQELTERRNRKYD